MTHELARLIQPRSPRFRLLIALDELVAGISWILRTHTVPVAVTGVLAGFAVSQVLLGRWTALRRMADNAPGG